MKKILFLLLLLNQVHGEWEKTHFLWHFAIAGSCDVMPERNPFDYFNYQSIILVRRKPVFLPERYFGIKKGDTVWLQSRFLAQFCSQVLPKIADPFVLVMSDGDENFPSDIHLSEAELEQLLDDDRIIAVFSQNCDYQGTSPKVYQMPIGIDFHTIAYIGTGRWGVKKSSPGEQERFLKHLIRKLPPTPARKKRAFVDFQHRDTMNNRYKEGKYPENRQQIFQQLLRGGLIDYSPKQMNRNELWKTKGQYAFSISPHGGGLDCHRTWEDLALGCIVIVKTSPLDPMYEGLPVVIVDDWAEVTAANMDIWLEQFGDALSNPSYRERITTAYWWSKIQAVAEPYKG